MALALLSGAAFGQVPASNDTSDPYLNTGMGTGALSAITPTAGTNCVESGECNTAVGYSALASLTTGYSNTAVGEGAMQQSKAVNFNTAVGLQALSANSGNNNTGVGSSALYANEGNNNTGVGYSALFQSSTGSNNSAVGYDALAGAFLVGVSGSNNTAIGASALQAETTGGSNTASGQNALADNATGGFNTATGSAALYNNVSGSNNTADGEGALYETTGGNNTAVGQNALRVLTTGTGNIALGYQSGDNVTTGSNNIEIGNAGVAADTAVIKIGTQGSQTKAYIAGIYYSGVSSGLPVYVNSAGQLGYSSSSERYKTNVHSLASNTEKLARLRPVSFNAKTDPNGTIQYGLIAEEVEKVYPELVIHDSEGTIQGVRYDELAPILLNVVQRDHEHAQAQDVTIAAQANEIRDLEQQVARVSELEQRLSLVLQQLKVGDKVIAQR
jgi:hypothetical protein